jgi:hypothetical protein
MSVARLPTAKKMQVPNDAPNILQKQKTPVDLAQPNYF